MANIEDSRGEEKDDKPAGHPGPTLHTARLPHGQHRAVARLQEEHQSFRAKLIDMTDIQLPLTNLIFLPALTCARSSEEPGHTAPSPGC